MSVESGHVTSILMRRNLLKYTRKYPVSESFHCSIS